MALILDKMEIKLSKDSEGNLRVCACAVKSSSEDAGLRSYYEKEMSISSEDVAELSDQFDAIQAQLKSEDNLS